MDAAQRISTRFQQLIPQIVALHEHVARDAGMPSVALQALHVLSLHGRPMSPSDLATATGQPRSTITRVLGHLEESGYITRSTVPSDLRRSLISIVPRTVAPLGARFDHYADAFEAASRKFSAAELEVVARYWDVLAEALD
jgi:DNA-binding MarR family transcriptional regulator